MTPSLNENPMTKPWILDRLRRARAGTVAVEFGLLALPFVAIIFGIVEFGMVAWTQASMQFAVEAAARCASVNTTTCGTAAQIEQYAASRMLAPGVTAANFTYAAASCGNQVSASMSYAFLVEVFLPASVTLTAQSGRPA